MDPTAISEGAPGELAQPPAIRERCRLYSFDPSNAMSWLSKGTALLGLADVLKVPAGSACHSKAVVRG